MRTKLFNTLLLFYIREGDGEEIELVSETKMVREIFIEMVGDGDKRDKSIYGTPL
jgi:hypothetical protein